ncbi:MAG TPA: replicative DNA helicase [Candidatus Paceibacterota bacterium]|nr:replicative DNA helicase [Candidatus Paceibacterota bacterium]
MPPTKKSQLKIPPQNLDAEQAVLGSILIDKNAIYRVADLLIPPDFYSPAHETIYDAILTLYAKSQPIDVMSVTNFLKEKDRLVGVGGSGYLAELTNQVTTASHVTHYAEIVKKNKILRELIRASAEITEDAFDQTKELDDLMDAVEKKIFDISQKSTPQNLMPLKDELAGAYERMAKLADGGGKLRGVPTGFPALDNKLSGLQKSDLIVLGARPSSGKTSLALDIARNAAQAGACVGIFSLEMSREQVIDRIISAESGVPLWNILTGRIKGDEEFGMVRDALDRLSGLRLFIDDSASLKVMEMHSMARRLQMEHGLDLLIVDYLQLIRPRTNTDNVVTQITEISHGLKALARDLKVPVLALSQLSRGVEQRDHKMPRLSDLRDSGCLTGDTLIMRADTGELVTIKSLADRAEQVPIPVYALTDGWQVVPQPLVKAFSSGRKKIYEMVLRSGKRIKASANHPFRLLTNWQALEDLRVGDRIATPAKLEPTAASDALDENEIILLAHLLGDGCILPNQPFHYTTADPDNLAAVCRAARSLFGIAPRIVRQKNWWHVYLPSPRHLTHGINHPITDWFKRLGIPLAHSYDKIIPAAIFRSPNRSAALFLHHLWATDGNISWKRLRNRQPAASIYYSSTSRTLAGQVQHLLLRLGIPSSEHPSIKSGYRPNYQIHVQGSAAQLKFLRMVGCFGARGGIALELMHALEAITPNSNLDVLPQEAWRSIIEPAKTAAGMSWRDLAAGIGVAYNGTALFKSGIGRGRLERLAAALDSDVVRQYAAADVTWDEIVSITPLGVEEVYDATVADAHNFIANDIIVHNSIEQDSDVVMFIYRKETTEYVGANDAGGAGGGNGGESNLTQILIAKHRNGPIGEVDLMFDKERTSFRTVDKRYEEIPL